MQGVGVAGGGGVGGGQGPGWTRLGFHPGLEAPGSYRLGRGDVCGEDGAWSMVLGPWSRMVHGPWALVHGPWSMVNGPWSMVHVPWSKFKFQKHVILQISQI